MAYLILGWCGGFTTALGFISWLDWRDDRKVEYHRRVTEFGKTTTPEALWKVLEREEPQ